MEYFAGLDVSMAETQICVMARNGSVIHKAKVPSTPADIAAELAQLPTCRRIVFETGRMAHQVPGEHVENADTPRRRNRSKQAAAH